MFLPSSTNPVRHFYVGDLRGYTICFDAYVRLRLLKQANLATVVRAWARSLVLASGQCRVGNCWALIGHAPFHSFANALSNRRKLLRRLLGALASCGWCEWLQQALTQDWINVHRYHTATFPFTLRKTATWVLMLFYTFLCYLIIYNRSKGEMRNYLHKNQRIQPYH